MSDDLVEFGQLPQGWKVHSIHASVGYVHNLVPRVCVLFVHDSGTHVEWTISQRVDTASLIRLLDFALTVEAGHIQIIKPDREDTDAGNWIRALRDGSSGNGEDQAP